jgi:DNA-directed RNA polymerase sigma subunit (sigma70/sigma32)
MARMAARSIDRRLDAAMARVRRRVRLSELPLVEPDTTGERQVEDEELVLRIMTAARLSEREALVIHERYWLETPLWQVGECIDWVGRERARQVEQRALEKLRKAARRVYAA